MAEGKRKCSMKSKAHASPAMAMIRDRGDAPLSARLFMNGTEDDMVRRRGELQCEEELV